jgi:2-keto-4-pentenoate hydratase/2-oxohepta-3-ene-1,7-dioic acid hydratase in catechol pathway
MATNEQNPMDGKYTNYVAYRDLDGKERIGHLDFAKSSIQPLSFTSGTALSNLYQVIEIGESHIKPLGNEIPLSSIHLLPPISGRDILAVGKNYSEHAVEFNSSGYDSSDKVDQPTHPVIFTKRATSIIASGEPILPHPEFTKTLDYEGEIGVIIGKSGFRIREADALEHVWGYTIINDVTARERQRDHKQFYIGKSADTFCPMGPIAVPACYLPKTLRVQTHVNGKERQNSTINDLIFSVPVLVRTLSEAQTLQPGDVIATGTPAGKFHSQN